MTAVARVVVAGGAMAAEMAATLGTATRALVVFQGRTLLEIVVDALCESDSDERITVVGDVPESPRYRRVPDHGDFVANVFAGIASCNDAEWILLTSSDMPFLDGTAVTEFMSAALHLGMQRGAEFIYPIVPVATCYERYPGIPRTSIRLREGRFTGGNMMLARPEFMLRSRPVIGQAYAARKEPLKLAAMLGLGTILRLLTAQTVSAGALTIDRLERSVGQMIGGSVAALICSRPEIATDLDKASDFERARAIADEARANP